MKRYVCGVLLSVCGAVHAQSSVDLYGVIDAGITYVNNTGGSRLVAFDDSANVGNRVGLRGTEDLGGGYRAIFTLENGFALGTGKFRQGGRMFGRQAYVGLENGLGSVTLGNQYDYMSEWVAPFSATGFAFAYGAHLGDFDREAGDRLENAVKATTANWNGFRAGAMYSFGNVAGSVHTNSAWSVAMKFDRGPLSAAAVYTRINNPHDIAALDPYYQAGVTTFLGQAVATRDPATGQVTDLYPYSNAFAVDSQSVAGVGGSYQLGKLTLMGNVTFTTFKGYGTHETFSAYEAGATYSVTPALLAIVGYQYEHASGAHWHQPTAGVYYYLSKRTSLYTALTYMAASGAYASAGQGYEFAPSSNHHQMAARVAMIHRF
ncbi:porin [Burkholderia lata]|uniref:porin n=1 Tax=Burkholderia lata (strain ATCC 17760 / DSM 23089 / LMG 22485 / NCIMB 9086 / R18194 / 383) TaxID=482957 RepID=UPI001452F36F|nr:porin [Burkholderia lata]VWC21273.1 porin [Burkholderia lata]